MKLIGSSKVEIEVSTLEALYEVRSLLIPSDHYITKDRKIKSEEDDKGISFCYSEDQELIKTLECLDVVINYFTNLENEKIIRAANNGLSVESKKEKRRKKCKQ